MKVKDLLKALENVNLLSRRRVLMILERLQQHCSLSPGSVAPSHAQPWRSVVVGAGGVVVGAGGVVVGAGGVG